ncbi:MAG TPA: hypothetical protein DCS29_03740 [Candidatus Magasanikbacteria bacterium]|nr:MAG: hypothetical protein A2479_01690 [Candidatus Magasanikbacteria bacterium RIFOXYC2_FULL_39_8]HAT03855.1 hypothetical protein [Candidatus Magasanikbacteria bacterium]
MNTYSQKRQSLRQKKEAIRNVLLSTTFRTGLTICIVVFGFMYVWQTNTVSTKGYLISDLEQKIQELEQETRGLEVNIAKHRSMQNLQSRLSETNFIVAANVDYMTLSGNVVAKR